MRHLRIAAFEVSLLPDGMVQSAALGPLVPTPCASQAVPPRLGRTSVEAVDLPSIAAGAQRDLRAAAAAVEESVGDRRPCWPRRRGTAG